MLCLAGLAWFALAQALHGIPHAPLSGAQRVASAGIEDRRVLANLIELLREGLGSFLGSVLFVLKLTQLLLLLCAQKALFVREKLLKLVAHRLEWRRGLLEMKARLSDRLFGGRRTLVGEPAGERTAQAIALQLFPEGPYRLQRMLGGVQRLVEILGFKRPIELAVRSFPSESKSPPESSRARPICGI